MQLSFQFQDSTIHFDVSYSRRRKTISITVEASGKVRVVAPEGISEDILIKQVKSQATWITNKLSQSQNSQSLTKELVNGECFLYLGRNYPLKLIIDNTIIKPEVAICQDHFRVVTHSRDPQVINNAIEAWYRLQALKYIQERLPYFQTIVGVRPAKVTIKTQQTRWGSCSSLGNLNFNWRAIMAPAPVLDYLIVHELCHLIHLNHSKDFWDLVSAILPDYKERKDWLKKNGHQLMQR